MSNNFRLKMILVGILFIGLSQYANVLWGRLVEGGDPFFFPAAFFAAAIYGWLSRSYWGTFLVGFLAMPYLIPFPPFQTGSVIFNFFKSIFNPSDYNFLEIVIFLGFGVAAGLFGMGLVKLVNWRKRKKS